MNGIFNDEDRVIENIHDSARELGANIKPKEKTSAPTAKPKKNCKMCYGRGYVTLSFPGNDGNSDTYNTYCGCVKTIN